MIPTNHIGGMHIATVHLFQDSFRGFNKTYKSHIGEKKILK